MRACSLPASSAGPPAIPRAPAPLLPATRASPPPRPQANSAILNALLTLLNERLFDNGSERLEVPLLCLVGASNELPESEELDALYDRFLIRRNVAQVPAGARAPPGACRGAGWGAARGAGLRVACWRRRRRRECGLRCT